MPAHLLSTRAVAAELQSRVLSSYILLMILHKLVARFCKHGDDAIFYQLQAQDALRWLQMHGVTFGQQTHALDLGCGHGVFGYELVKRGCQVTFSDEQSSLMSEIGEAPFRKFNIDEDDFANLGQYDLVVCSNVLEHLRKPERFIGSVHQLLSKSGKLYLSWTNWLSPWGGHEFSPFHYFGARRGHLLYDRLTGRKRKHNPFENLFPTYIGTTLRMVAQNDELQMLNVAPRYYTEFEFVMRIPGVREFAAWNCALLIGRRETGIQKVVG
jgi:SAM-dependent methyltransferase